MLLFLTYLRSKFDDVKSRPNQCFTRIPKFRWRVAKWRGVICAWSQVEQPGNRFVGVSAGYSIDVGAPIVSNPSMGKECGLSCMATIFGRLGLIAFDGWGAVACAP